MTAILKVDTIQDTSGNNIINENAGTVTIGKAGNTTNIVGTLQNDGAALVTGKVLQVVSVAKTDTFSTTSTSFVDVTGLTLNITPSSTSSKILVIPNLNIGSSTDNHIALTLFRGTTAIGIGDTASNRPRASFTGSNLTQGSTYTWNMQTASFNFLDSPNTTSATTYSVKVGGNGSTTIYVNRSGRDRDITTEDGRYASTITLMEILA